jgi:hypothetical protein
LWTESCLTAADCRDIRLCRWAKIPAIVVVALLDQLILGSHLKVRSIKNVGWRYLNRQIAKPHFENCQILVCSYLDFDYFLLETHLERILEQSYQLDHSPCQDLVSARTYSST